MTAISLYVLCNLPQFSMGAGTGSCLDLAGEQQRDRGNGEDKSNDREGVAEADDEGLALNEVTDGDDRLMLRSRGVGNTVGDEVVR